MLTTKLLDRFKEIGDLAPGWDGDDAVPVNTAVLQLAQCALECLLSQHAFPEPELGAVEDGRLDLSWHAGFSETLRVSSKEKLSFSEVRPRSTEASRLPATNDLNIFCTLDEEEVRIHARNNKEKLRDLPLGDEKNRLQTLVEILRNELKDIQSMSV